MSLDAIIKRTFLHSAEKVFVFGRSITNILSVFMHAFTHYLYISIQVLDQNNGRYRCEKCNMEMEDFQWRLILSLCIADPTDNQWVNCFQEQAEQILGFTSQELGQMSQQDPDQYTKVFQNATLKPFNFRLSCKSDNYNDEQRVRHTVRAVFALDFAEQNKRKIQELENEGIELPAGVTKSNYM
jgi:hypothetical protein